ncbi:hypothetical protein NI17_007795 [Thermobifida halotolerans]|uniref:Uncharacterized protein n=1 Tax=Thermobifida halotolerans TaxID=483545 RepID=A0A399G5V0_9ACTN|nr:hypothetical protein [Thermobifida halotolerans]UOE21041.1 hypothetical protein NI17_007795 [Thermobifida halotolerans]
MRLIPSTRTGCIAATAGVVVVGGLVFLGYRHLLGDDEFTLPVTALTSPAPTPTPADVTFTLPDTCAEAGATELVGDLAPQGTALVEDSEESDDADARQLSCVWTDGTDADSEALMLVFAVNIDPSDRVAVVRLPDEQREQQDMGWEVDVDVNVDTYRTTATDPLGGELKYVTTVDGSSRQLSLELPGEVHIAAVALFSDIPREDMEQLLVTAAGQLQQ